MLPLSLRACTVVLPVLLCTVASASAQPTPRGDPIRTVYETRDVSGITGVVHRGSGHLVITQGGDEGLRIEGGATRVESVATAVDDGVITIAPDDDDGRASGPLYLHLTVPDLRHVRLEGSGSVEVRDMQGAALSFTVTGSGSANVTGLVAERLTVAGTGSGSVRASGRVHHLDALIAGSGSLDAGDLRASTARVQIRASGSAVVRVSGRLERHEDGSGGVRNLHGSTR